MQYHIIIGTILLLSGSAAGDTTSTAPAVTFTLSLEDAQPMVFTPVVLHVKIANHLEREVQAHLGANGLSSYRFEILDSVGDVRQTASPDTSGFQISGDTMLQPHGVYEEVVHLNEWFGFETPGRYRVRISSIAKIETSDGTSVATNLPVTVVLVLRPYSRAELEEICGRLLAEAKDGAHLERAVESGKRLGWIRHPDAVPCLVRAIEIPFELTQHAAATALATIATPESAAALLEAHKKAEKDTRWVFRGALQRLRHHVRLTDPQLVRKIDDALQSQ